MRLYVSRQRNGMYMLTRQTPLVATVDGTDQSDVYVAAGDPVGFRHVCPWFVSVLWNVKDLEPCTWVRVKVTGEAIE